MTDIHSHILPGVDDGAKNINESVELLKILKAQSINNVIATPHFYAYKEDFEDYNKKIDSAYKQLNSEISKISLPNVILGYEVFYFLNMGVSDSIGKFCIDNSNYMLLELPFDNLDNAVLTDLYNLQYRQGILLIIAHIERYSNIHGFKNLLKFLKSEGIPAQVNLSSFMDLEYKRVLKHLIKGEYVKYLGSDTHSVDKRPPLYDKALLKIEKDYGVGLKNMFINNSDLLYNDIIKKNNKDYIL